MNQFYPSFLQNIRSHNLISPQDSIILAFSGGKDSVTLFHLLKRLQEDIPFLLRCAYFNHRLRTDADDEEKWVRDFCQTHKVPLIIGGKDVMALKSREKLNLEHAASLSRYHFFKEVSSQSPDSPTPSKVATAHTKSDLTETFFIKLFRGSGLQGLSSIYSKKSGRNDNTIIRPLLLFTQEEIYAFLHRNRFPFYTDYTNRQEDFLRNKIRHNLVPQIQKIEPNIDKHIFRTVSIIQEEYDFFSEKANHILNQSLILEKILPVAGFRFHHPALQRHIIREYIRRLKGNLLNIDFQHIEALRERHDQIGGIAIPGLQFAFRRGFIFPNDLSIPGYSYPIDAPVKSTASVKIPQINARLKLRKVTKYKKPADNSVIIVPADLLRFPLKVRSPQKKDKYIKINTSINQTLFEMIRASGTPSQMRNLCPVLENADKQLIWAYGSPVADNFKVKNQEGRQYIKISIASGGPPGAPTRRAPRGGAPWTP